MDIFTKNTQARAKGKLLAFTIGSLLWLTPILSQGQCNDISINVLNPRFCQGNAAVFTATGAPKNSRYLWVLNQDTIFGQGFDTASFIVMKPGTYAPYVRIILPNGKTCVQQNTPSVTVGAAPQGLSVTASSRKICDLPATIDLSTNGNSNYTYDWLIEGDGDNRDGGDYTKAGSSIKHTFTGNGYKTVVLRTTNEVGCQSTLKLDSFIYAYDLANADFDVNTQKAECDETIIQPEPNLMLDTSAKVLWSYPGARPNSSQNLYPGNISYNTPGDYDISLSIETKGGCKTVINQKDAVLVGTSITPSLQFSKHDICAGSSITFNNVTPVPSNGQEEWIFQGGSEDPSISTTSKKVVDFHSAGTFGVYYKYAKGGCESEVFLQDTIKVRDFQARFKPSYTCNCEPGKVAFKNQSSTTLKGEALRYLWRIYNPQGMLIFTSNDQDMDFTFRSMGRFTVSLTVTNELGCSKTHEETINFRPLKAAFTTSAKQSCLGETVTTQLDPSETCLHGISRYKWYFYDAQGNILDTQSTKNGAYTFTEEGFYDVALEVENASGCVDYLRKSREIEVFQLSATYSASKTDVCIGDNVELSLKHHPIPVNAQHTWLLQDSQTGARVTATSKSFNFSFLEAGTYNLHMVTAKSAQCADTIKVDNLFKVSGTKIALDYNQNASCLPLVDSLKAKTLYNIHHQNPSDALQYNWTTNTSNGISLSHPTAKSTQVYIDQGGYYDLSLQVVNADGCTTRIDSADFFKAGVVSKFSAPKVACVNIPFQFNNQSFVNPKRYQWLRSDTALHFSPDSTSRSPEGIFSTPGDYEVQLVTENNLGCLDTSKRNIRVIDFGFTFESPDTNGLCSPAFVTFSAQGVNVDEYLWEFGDGQRLRTRKDSVAHLYDIQGLDVKDNSSFTVTVTAISKYGCRKTITKKDYITVWGPQPKFIMQNKVGTGSTDTRFIDLSKNVSRMLLHYDDNTPVDSSFGTHTYKLNRPNLALNVYKPYMVAFDDRNCMAVYPRPGEGDSVIVYNVPQPDFYADTVEACAPYTFKFYNTTKFADSFAWYGDGVDTAFSHDISPELALDAGTHTIELVAYNANGDARRLVRKDYLQVHQLPQVQIGAENRFSCPNVPLKLIDSSTSVNPIIRWEWSVIGQQGTSVYTDRHPEHTFNEKGFYDLQLKLTDAKQCVDSQLIKGFVEVNTPMAPMHSGIDGVGFENNYQLKLQFSQQDHNRISQFFIFQDNQLDESMVTPVGLDADDSIQAGVHKIAFENNPFTRYQLRGIDQCKDTVALGNWHRPVFFNINYQEDDDKDEEVEPYFPVISWNAYEGWENIKGYEVWRSKDGNKEMLLKSVDPGVTTIIDSQVCNNNYEYHVRAIHPQNGWASNSQRDTTSPNYVPPVGNIQLAYSTTQGQQVLTTWNAHQHPGIVEYVVSRYDENFDYVRTYAIVEDTFLQDSDVYVHDKVYQYKVRAIDYCRNTTELSNMRNSIVLTPVREEQAVNLTWNRVHLWPEDVSYVVERKIGDGDYTVLASQTTDTTFLDEDVFDVQDEQFQYRISAYHDGFQVYSNEVQFIPDIRIFIPNAFSPNNDGVNDEFYVVGSAAQSGSTYQYDKFSLSILNRWGETVFQTNDLDEKWNGSYKGKDAPAGTYVFRVQFRDQSGKFYYHAGNLTLIK